MKFGTSTHAISEFGNDVKPFHQALAEVRECGFEQLLLMSPAGPAMQAGDRPGAAMLNLFDSDLGAVKQAIEEAGLEIASVHGGLVNLSSGETRQQSIAQLHRLADCARALGCGMISHNAGQAPQPLLPHEQKREVIEQLAEVMSAAAEYAPELQVAVDIHYHSPAETIADCEYLLERLPANAGLLLNIGHMTTCEQPGWELLERHAGRIPMIAYKDHRTDAERPHPVTSVELGTGGSPFAEYIRVLKRRPTEHVHLITFEHVPLEEKKAALARSLQYLRRLWEEVEA
jgi:sugar phosphate isomerase/epimerase